MAARRVFPSACSTVQPLILLPRAFCKTSGVAFATAPQTFKPHKEKQGLTKPVSPELRTKKRALTVCSAGQRRDLVMLSQLDNGVAEHGVSGVCCSASKPDMCFACFLFVAVFRAPRLGSTETGPTPAARPSSTMVATGEQYLTACPPGTDHTHVVHL